MLRATQFSRQGCLVLILLLCLHVFFFFCQTEPLQPTEVRFPSGSQKARYKERKCHPRNKRLTTWGWDTRRPPTSSQSPQAETFQAPDVHSRGRSFFFSFFYKNEKKDACSTEVRDSVMGLVVVWLHVSLQAAPLVPLPFCNMRPWSQGFSLQKMKRNQKRVYRWGFDETRLLALSSTSVRVCNKRI